MHSAGQLLADVSQPRQASVGRIGNGAFDVEVEHRLGRARPHLREPSPLPIAFPRRSVPYRAVTNVLDAGAVLVCRPVPLEVIEKSRPIVAQSVPVEELEWKRKPVVDADQGRPVLSEPLDQPLSDTAPRPVPATTRRRENFGRRQLSIAHVHPKPREA